MSSGFCERDYNANLFFNYCLVSIPPYIWNGFSSLNDSESIIANCSDIPHDKNEIIRIPYDDPKIPYNWKFNF